MTGGGRNVTVHRCLPKARGKLFFKCVFALLAKYLLTHRTNFNEKLSLDIYLQLTNIWSRPRSRCPQQLVNLGEHKIGFGQILS